MCLQKELQEELADKDQALTNKDGEEPFFSPLNWQKHFNATSQWWKSCIKQTPGTLHIRVFVGTKHLGNNLVVLEKLYKGSFPFDPSFLATDFREIIHWKEKDICTKIHTAALLGRKRGKISVL